MNKWPRRKDVRREEVKRVRAEGAAAAEAGRHRQTNPYGNTMNRYQWFVGYDDREAEMVVAHTKEVEDGG